MNRTFAIFAMILAVVFTTQAQTPPAIWKPALQTSWQWQLSTPVDLSVNVQMYDIDMFDNPASVVTALHAKGRKAVCYIDVGTWENWRPDASRFPAVVKGATNGWPGERWLDIRRIDILGPIMTARLQACKSKGFDGIEPDNIDGYSNSSGFSLTYLDQIAYNRFISNAAHSLGLAIGLKNDVDQALDLVNYFDFVIDEQCFQYSECAQLMVFIDAGKPVFEVEYGMGTNSFCPEGNALNFNSMKKRLALGSWRVPCR